MFQNIPVFDGKDPAMFNDWVERLELACSLSRRDIKEEAICYSAGPVRQMLLTLPNDPDYTWTMMIVGNLEKLFQQKDCGTCSSSVYRFQETETRRKPQKLHCLLCEVDERSH